MLNHARQRAAGAIVAGGLTVVLGLAADDSKAPQDKAAPAQAAKAGRGRIAGVITKVEPLGGADASHARAWRLTVNTAVVWRDFVRDQATEPEKASHTGVNKAAEKGKESVATEGHPQASDLLATAELDGQTNISQRYRSSTDSVSDGAPTAEGASAVEDAAAQAPSDRGIASKAEAKDADKGGPKARKLEVADLKPGLWVEVDSRVNDQSGHAVRIVVLRPVGGADVSPEKEKVPETKAVTPRP
ncbi:hypothetical protein OJF2_67470 [Aquisphaera giovannonii]|uniref:Uncharacterized protein n=1 Tax=Aquisphaera giovannonii TaxID=406548 RepID=A0A5B9WD42_9BACT|nr:hypothetical protein [Aquisphaera giovannonii]QEH38149.1 hypothetical protein OJF2_67470 [Aquisphaera giovannonii]